MENLYITKIIKTGSSLCVVIPVEILRGMKWERGDYISFTMFEGEIVALIKLNDDTIRHLKAQAETIN